MKKNLLPDMQKVKMTSREGKEFVMEIHLRKRGGTTYVFLADTTQLGSSRLAKDAMYYIERIVARLNLDGTNTVFFRHIYQEQMGSAFGRFNVDWKNDSGPSYKFQMLTNIDDLQSIGQIIKSSTPVDIQDQATARKSA